MSTISKKDLIQHLKRHFNQFDQKMLSSFIDNFFNTISYEIVEAKSIYIPNWGKFVLSSSINFDNNCKKIKFLPSRSLKNKINS